MMLVFSYGSNMSLIRLRQRVPSATRVVVARLIEHQLRFHKISKKDGSGKCDAEYTRDPDNCVYGVVFEISEKEKGLLDRKEGLGYGYDEKQVAVTGMDGSELHALMYFATAKDSSLKPFHWYKEHVLRGARENNLPAEYVAQIESIQSIPDPDSERSDREKSIYRKQS